MAILRETAVFGNDQIVSHSVSVIGKDPIHHVGGEATGEEAVVYAGARHITGRCSRIFCGALLSRVVEYSRDVPVVARGHGGHTGQPHSGRGSHEVNPPDN